MVENNQKTERYGEQVQKAGIDRNQAKGQTSLRGLSGLLFFVFNLSSFNKYYTILCKKGKAKLFNIISDQKKENFFVLRLTTFILRLPTIPHLDLPNHEIL